ANLAPLIEVLRMAPVIVQCAPLVAWNGGHYDELVTDRHGMLDDALHTRDELAIIDVRRRRAQAGRIEVAPDFLRRAAVVARELDLPVTDTRNQVEGCCDVL